MKTNIFLIWALAGAMISCETEKLNIGAPEVNVNGGPVEASLTPTSAQVQVIVSSTDGIKEVGIRYGLQTDLSALVTYGVVVSSTEKKGEYLFDVTDCESATRYSYVAYALLESGEVAYSVVRSFTTVAAELSAEPSRISFDAGAQTGELVISTTFDSWDFIAGSEDWLSYQKSGDRLIVTALENLTAARRVATVKFTAGSRTLNLAVTQDPPTLAISRDSLVITDGSAASGSFTVETAATWSVTSDVPWLTCERNGTTVNFSVSASTELYRIGHATVKLGAADDGMTVAFTVEQYSMADLTGLEGAYTLEILQESRGRGDVRSPVLTKEQYLNLAPEDFEWAWDRRGDFGSLDFDYIFSGGGANWVYPLLLKMRAEESPYAARCLRVEVVGFLDPSNTISNDKSYYDPKLRKFYLDFELYETWNQGSGQDVITLTRP
ncbi:MAG: hypothetical protein LBG30_07085 [Odoribacteraceae bacterium]|jgi:hypothetical protein|nr:hypothetical protein [Odoribacteraceae bacterium]